jgi:hypothetical protein
MCRSTITGKFSEFPRNPNTPELCCCIIFKIRTCSSQVSSRSKSPKLVKHFYDFSDSNNAFCSLGKRKRQKLSMKENTYIPSSRTAPSWMTTILASSPSS